MDKSAYFEGIAGIGSLYCDHVYLEYECEPILFTCVDENQQCYLCLCCELRGGQRWLVTRCSFEMLSDLSEQRIDIYTALHNHDRIIVIERDIQGMESARIMPVDKVDPLDFPEEGVLCPYTTYRDAAPSITLDTPYVLETINSRVSSNLVWDKDKNDFHSMPLIETT